MEKSAEFDESEGGCNDTETEVSVAPENIIEGKSCLQSADNNSFDNNEEMNSQEPETSDQEVTHSLKTMSAGATKLREWLNKLLRIEMTDGRSLVGVFLCTDRDANIILGSCSEYLPEDEEECDSDEQGEEPRMLGLVMVPGKHIVSISIDKNRHLCNDNLVPLSENIKSDDVI